VGGGGGGGWHGRLQPALTYPTVGYLGWCKMNLIYVVPTVWVPIHLILVPCEVQFCGFVVVMLSAFSTTVFCNAIQTDIMDIPWLQVYMGFVHCSGTFQMAAHYGTRTKKICVEYSPYIRT